MTQPITYDEFRRLVCISAQQYYDFLTARFNKGILSSGTRMISVYQITSGRVPGEYILTTNEKVTFPDSCQVWIMGRYVPSIEILTVDTIRKSVYSVRISDKKGILTRFSQLKPGDIQIISDLRFLITKLKRFYEATSFGFLPPAPGDIPQLPEEFINGLSEEQLQAIDAVFSSPISYISGAPGTGKTRAVLSRCILRYVLAKKRIILLAPTNNAVEQMLRGVLPILRDAGIDLECVYRLGTATEEFAKEYPQIVGDTALETLLNSLSKQKSFYESQMDKAYSLRSKAQSIQNRLDDCISIHNQVAELIGQLVEVDFQIAAAEKDYSKTVETINSLQADYDTASARSASTRNVMNACENSIAQINKRIKNITPFFWMKKQREKLESELFSLLAVFPKYKENHTDALAVAEKYGQDLTQARRMLIECVSRKAQLEQTSHRLIHQAQSLADRDLGYEKAVHNALVTSDRSLDEAHEFLAALVKQYDDAVTAADALPCDTYKAELDSIKQQFESIGSSSKASQRRNALVLAGTIDSSLSALFPHTNPSSTADNEPPILHVFLDEAGYTCLAKAMAAFAPGAPVTFLGDHKQLPPVCEMNRIPVEYAPVCLWALPTAYYTELIYGDFIDLYDRCYVQSIEPSFREVVYSPLNTSYRFGPFLADILAKYVYTDQFHGVADAPFEIQVINAPYIQGAGRNSSQSEAEAINTYLHCNPGDDVAILTPYKDQVKLLRKVLPRDFKDNILTVHRAQGCEWDTVILSITDTYRPYFTNSNLPLGRSVLNTAISRAKRRLIIACDIAVWKHHSDQLVTELIHCGRQDATYI